VSVRKGEKMKRPGRMRYIGKPKKTSFLTQVKKSISKQSKSTIKSISKGAKTAVKGAKIAKAAAGIVGDVTNPVKMGKVVVNAARGKGIVYPGSKYIGPGNAMNLGKPNSKADAAAYQHDLAYDKYLKDGHKKKKVYAGFSKADQQLMNKSDVTTKHGLVTYGGMAVKKGLYKLGLTGKMLK